MIAFSRGIGILLCCLVVSAMSPWCKGGDEPPCVTLLVQGIGPVASSKAAEASWGELKADAQGKFGWSGFVGQLIGQGWKFGGVFRSKSEQVREKDLDRLGASEGPCDFYVLASSIPAQEDGLVSRARELATAVAAVRKRTGARNVRLICYSAGGVAARLWMQGTLEECPYESGSVGHLITVATPHLGIGGVVGPLRDVWDRYKSLAPDSRLLQRINQELDLPTDARYTAVVIQGTGTSFSDTGRVYKRHLRLSADQVNSLPPLMRTGHDGVVHCLSAQLHLTPAAARYENSTDRGVEVVFCRLQRFHGDRAEDLTIHTAAMRDEALWRTLLSVLDVPQPVAEAGEQCSHEDAHRRWATQIALHLTELHVQLRHLTGKITRTEISRLQAMNVGLNECAIRWKCLCDTDVRRVFRGVESREYVATGSFELSFDRFGRPRRLVDLVVELLPVEGD